MASRQRGPARTTPTRSFPLQSSGAGPGASVGLWAGGTSILLGLLLAGLAWSSASPSVQVTMLVLLAVLLVGLVTLAVGALREALAAQRLTAAVWLLLAGALVVAVSLGAVAALALPR